MSFSVLGLVKRFVKANAPRHREPTLFEPEKLQKELDSLLGNMPISELDAIAVEELERQEESRHLAIMANAYFAAAGH